MRLMPIQGKNCGRFPVGELLTKQLGRWPQDDPQALRMEKVYALGGKGSLLCADVKSGKKNLAGSLG